MNAITYLVTAPMRTSAAVDTAAHSAPMVLADTCLEEATINTVSYLTTHGIRAVHTIKLTNQHYHRVIRRNPVWR